MPQESRCPECGAKLPPDGSMCPRCLLKVGLEHPGNLGIEDETLSAFSAAVSEAAGERIGPYKILETLGEGGMGMVFLAEQQEPIRRRVAVKVIKLGMDSREVIARFEAERQALALLNHPNIAQVFDAGTTPGGRPYFVMEHVAGIPITDYCDKHRLEASDRLVLFNRVCEAVHHAHQRGLIHRDIKPSNILVAVVDGEAVPKVIDFGVAKATNQRLTEKTLFTQRGLIVGTPEYMSPEQAEMGELDVDITTDIYSLGVLLYELLTGTLPFDARSLRRAGLAEMQRIIREEDPLKPSTKVSELGDSASQVAQRRHTDPASLRKMLRGDLDWIVLKSLEKDRTRRYQSATELTADVGRHLDHEPVSAGPPALGYKIQKFVRRHRGGVAAGIGFIVLLLAATITSTLLYARAESERKARSRQLIDLMVQQGMEKADQGEHLDALPWLTRALELDEDDEHSHRLRIQSLLDHTPSLLFLWEHEDSINHAEFSPDGQLVASASDDGTARLWSTTLGRQFGKALHHEAAVNYVDFSNNEKFVATASSDGTARIWSTETAEPESGPLGHDGAAVNWAFFSPAGERLITTAADGTVRAWSTKTGEMEWSFDYGENLRDIVFDEAGQRLIALGGPTARILDAGSGHLLQQIEPSAYYVRSAAFGPDDLLAVGSGDGKVTIWDLNQEPKLRHTLPVSWMLSEDGDVPVAIDQSGMLIASGSEGKVKAWNVKTGAEIKLRQTIDHQGVVTGADFVAGGNWIVTQGFDGSTRLWTTGGDPLTPLLRFPKLNAVDVTAHGDQILTADGNGLLRIWDLVTTMPTAQILEHSDYVWNAEFDPSGRYLATGSGWYVGVRSRGLARIWDLEQNRSINKLAEHGSGAEVVMSDDGSRVASISFDGTVFILDTRQGTVLSGPIRFPDGVYEADFNEDNSLLACGWHPMAWFPHEIEGKGGIRIVSTGSGDTVHESVGARGERLGGFLPSGQLLTNLDGQIRVWDDMESSEPLRSWETGEPGVFLVLSDDGSMVANYSGSEEVRVWETDTGSPVTSALRHDQTVNALGLSADNTKLAVGTFSGEVAVWDLGLSARIHTFFHEGIVFDVAFSPDDRWLVSVSVDGTARAWDLASGLPISVGLRHLRKPGLLQGAKFSPRGQRFVTTGFDAQVWSLTPAKLSAQDIRQVSELISARSIQGSSVQPITKKRLISTWENLSTTSKEALGPSSRQLAAWRLSRGSVGNVMQTVDATPFQGLTIRMTASAKVEADRGGQSRIWLRVDRVDSEAGFFDDMTDRPITDKAWQRYAIDVPVAENATTIEFGVIFEGEVKAWVDEIQLEVIDGAGVEPVREATNLGFEHTRADESPSGWRLLGHGLYDFETSDIDPVSGNRCLAVRAQIPTRLVGLLKRE